MKEQILSSFEYMAIFIGILIITVILASVVGRFFRALVKRSTDEMHNDPTNYLFLQHAVVAMIYVVGFGVAIYAIPSLRTLASSMLAGAGILAVAIGFASQHALSNIISGFFIIVFKPFRVRDRISLRTLSGIVEDITLRHTVIRDFENRRIVIPNSLISDDIIINADIGDGRICKWIEVGISYDSNVSRAKEIIHEEIVKHPLHIDTREPKDIEEGVELAPVKVISLGESSVNLRGWAWAGNSPDAFNMSCDLLESIKSRFDKEGIEIPFPHRTLVQKVPRSEKPKD